jgi:hypothetical protein
MRRVHLRRHPNILKRLLVHLAAFNLGLVMRKLLGKGTPRGLQDYGAALFLAILQRLSEVWALRRALEIFHDGPEALSRSSRLSKLTHLIIVREALSTTGC